MNRHRYSDQTNSSTGRRPSLSSIRKESTKNEENKSRGNFNINRSDSSIEVRTPIQQRLRRLQSNLREEQLKNEQETPPGTSSQSKRSISRRLSSTSSQRSSSPVPMTMSPPKRPQLKRRSDHNGNDRMEFKKQRMDKSPSPKRSPRTTQPNRHSLPNLPRPPQYENDIDMTDDSIQEEISSLRENTINRGDYSLSMAINSENKLVIKYQDHNDSNLSSVQRRLVEKQSNLKTLHIVVDTNIFIKDLSVLSKLMSRKFPDDLGYPIIVIPYIVLKELENLAHKGRGKPIELNAKAANKYINSQFTAKNPQLKGQNSADQRNKLLDIESGDDEVLNCCLQVKEANKKVILLSNDVNLRNKALFNEIPAFSIEGIEKKDLQIEFTKL